MRIKLAGFILLNALILNAAVDANAQCVQDERKVAFDKSNIARLKSSVCRSDVNDDVVQLKIETFRLSEGAAATLVAKRNPAALIKTLGKFRMIENDVYNVYSDLLSKFGETVAVKGDKFASITVTNSAYQDDNATFSESKDLKGKSVRTIFGSMDDMGNIDYPAIDEVKQLQQKIIPPNLSFFYQIVCEDGGTSNTSTGPKETCSKYDPKNFTMLFWRGMQADDVSDYQQRVKQYNSLLKKYKQDTIELATPRGLKLWQYMAGGTWPPDFIVLAGYKMEDGCEDDKNGGIKGWKFQYNDRELSLEATLIQNLSKAPVTLDELIGFQSSNSNLRPAISISTSSPSKISATPIVLQPGERVLFPNRILVSPSPGDIEQFSYRKTADAVFMKRGKNGFTGETASHRAPNLQDYVYGPETELTGVTSAGKSVNFNERALNFVNLTIGAEAGSCPYLLTKRGDGDWINNGKVLHTAKGHANEQTEILKFSGLINQFRLEEREPERAEIKSATLSLLLDDGTVVELAPKELLARSEHPHVELFWGESLDFLFEIPEQFLSATVIETRLAITGYYDRYSVLADREETEGRTIGSLDQRSNR